MMDYITFPHQFIKSKMKMSKVKENMTQTDINIDLIGTKIKEIILVLHMQWIIGLLNVTLPVKTLFLLKVIFVIYCFLHNVKKTLWKYNLDIFKIKFKRS